MATKQSVPGANEFWLRRMGGSSGGTQTPPKRKRRTIKHLKGKGYPGQWKVNPPKEGR